MKKLFNIMLAAAMSFGLCTVKVNAEAQETLTITSTTAVYGQNLTLTTSGGSGSGEITYTEADGSGKATIDGGVLTPVQAGTVTVTASKAADDTYEKADSAPTEITINKGELAGIGMTMDGATVNTEATVTAGKTYTFLATGTQTSDQVSFAMASTDAEIATVTTDGSLQALKAGTATLTVTITRDNNYNPYTHSVTLTVEAADSGSSTDPTFNAVAYIMQDDKPVFFQSLQDAVYTAGQKTGYNPVYLYDKNQNYSTTIVDLGNTAENPLHLYSNVDIKEAQYTGIHGYIELDGGRLYSSDESLLYGYTTDPDATVQGEYGAVLNLQDTGITLVSGTAHIIKYYYIIGTLTINEGASLIVDNGAGISGGTIVNHGTFTASQKGTDVWVENITTLNTALAMDGEHQVSLGANITGNAAVPANANVTLNLTYYTLSSDSGATLTNNGGNLRVTGYEGYLVNNAGGTVVDNQSGTTVISDGHFKGTLAKESGTLTAVGGYYDQDPSAFKASYSSLTTPTGDAAYPYTLTQTGADTSYPVVAYIYTSKGKLLFTSLQDAVYAASQMSGFVTVNLYEVNPDNKDEAIVKLNNTAETPLHVYNNVTIAEPPYMGIQGYIEMDGGRLQASDEQILYGYTASDSAKVRLDYGSILNLGANSITLASGNASIHEDYEIPAGTTFTVAAGASLTVEDQITLIVNGKFVNQGTVHANAGSIFQVADADGLNAALAVTDSHKITLPAAITGNFTVPAGETVELATDNGSITSTSGTTIVNKGTLTISGSGKISAGTDGVAVDSQSGSVVITGGSFKGTLNKADGAVLKVQGGSFSADPTAYLDTDYKVVSSGNTEYPYLVKSKSSLLVTISYLASAGGKVSSASESIDPDAVPAGSTALPDDGYEFVNWTDAGGNTAGTSAVFKPSKAEAATYTANFQKKSLSVTYTYADGTPADAPALPDTVTTAHIGDVLTLAAAPELAGYDFSGWQSADVQPAAGSFTMPGSSVTFVGTFTEKPAVNVTYAAAAGGKVSSASESLLPATGKAQGSTATADDGYQFANWKDSSGNVVSTDAAFTPAKVGGLNVAGSYTANFTPLTNIAYSVQHYQQNLTGTGYDLVNTDPATGTTGATVTAAARTYEGFSFDSGNADNITSGTVAGNGSLVLKLYYTRNSYSVTYAYSGTILTTASALPDTAEQKFGAAVSTAAAAAAPGYDFQGWSTEDAAVTDSKFTMPAKNVTLTGSFKEKADITMTYAVNDSSMGAVSSSTQSIAPASGIPAAITAAPASGYHFANWTHLVNGQAAEISTEAVFTPAKNADGVYEADAYTANFEKDPDDIAAFIITDSGTLKFMNLQDAVNAASKMSGQQMVILYTRDSVTTTVISLKNDSTTPLHLYNNVTIAEPQNTGIQGYIEMDGGKIVASDEQILYGYTSDADAKIQAEYGAVLDLESNAVTLVSGTAHIHHDYTIAAGNTFTVNTGATLIVDDGVTFTQTGTFTNNGVYIDSVTGKSADSPIVNACSMSATSDENPTYTISCPTQSNFTSAMASSTRPYVRLMLYKKDESNKSVLYKAVDITGNSAGNALTFQKSDIGKYLGEEIEDGNYSIVMDLYSSSSSLYYQLSNSENITFGTLKTGGYYEGAPATGCSITSTAGANAENPLYTITCSGHSDIISSFTSTSTSHTEIRLYQVKDGAASTSATAITNLLGITGSTDETWTFYKATIGKNRLDGKVIADGNYKMILEVESYNSSTSKFYQIENAENLTIGSVTSAGYSSDNPIKGYGTITRNSDNASDIIYTISCPDHKELLDDFQKYAYLAVYPVDSSGNADLTKQQCWNMAGVKNTDGTSWTFHEYMVGSDWSGTQIEQGLHKIQLMITKDNVTMYYDLSDSLQFGSTTEPGYSITNPITDACSFRSNGDSTNPLYTIYCPNHADIISAWKENDTGNNIALQMKNSTWINYSFQLPGKVGLSGVTWTFYKSDISTSYAIPNDQYTIFVQQSIWEGGNSYIQKYYKLTNAENIVFGSVIEAGYSYSNPGSGCSIASNYDASDYNTKNFATISCTDSKIMDMVKQRKAAESTEMQTNVYLVLNNLSRNSRTEWSLPGSYDETTSSWKIYDSINNYRITAGDYSVYLKVTDSDGVSHIYKLSDKYTFLATRLNPASFNAKVAFDDATGNMTVSCDQTDGCKAWISGMEKTPYLGFDYTDANGSYISTADIDNNLKPFTSADIVASTDYSVTYSENYLHSIGLGYIDTAGTVLNYVFNVEGYENFQGSFANQCPAKFYADNAVRDLAGTVAVTQDENNNIVFTCTDSDSATETNGCKAWITQLKNFYGYKVLANGDVYDGYGSGQDGDITLYPDQKKAVFNFAVWKDQLHVSGDTFNFTIFSRTFRTVTAMKTPIKGLNKDYPSDLQFSVTGSGLVVTSQNQDYINNMQSVSVNTSYTNSDGKTTWVSEDFEKSNSELTGPTTMTVNKQTLYAVTVPIENLAKHNIVGHADYNIFAYATGYSFPTMRTINVMSIIDVIEKAKALQKANTTATTADLASFDKKIATMDTVSVSSTVSGDATSKVSVAGVTGLAAVTDSTGKLNTSDLGAVADTPTIDVSVTANSATADPTISVTDSTGESVTADVQSAYDIKVEKSVNGGDATTVSTLCAPSAITLDTSGVSLKEGQSVAVVREHDGTNTVLATTANTDGTVTAYSDKFSKFYLVIMTSTDVAKTEGVVAGAKISGSLSGWSDLKANSEIMLYDSSVSDADIDADMRKLVPTLSLASVPAFGTGTAAGSTIGEQSFSFAGLDAAKNYKIAVYTPDQTKKSIVSISDAFGITGSAASVTLNQYYYGDLNNDGKINTADGVAVLRYFAKQASILGKDENNKNLKRAANINGDKNLDGSEKINTADGIAILRYFAKQDSAFNSLK